MFLKTRRGLDAKCGPLESEATALPFESQPLPIQTVRKLIGLNSSEIG